MNRSGFTINKAYRWTAVLLTAIILVTYGLTDQAARISQSPGDMLQSDMSPSTIDVIIDPGHGGVDGGAVGVMGGIEKDINLSISLYLRDMLTDAGLNVLMTRSTDISIHSDNAVSIRQKKSSDLKNRLAILNANPDAIVISIHQNSFTAGYVHGTMIYYGKTHQDSKTLAEYVRKFIKTLQPENEKQLKPAGRDLYLMSNAKSPAILVECGFLSNASEEALLKSQAYQQKMAQVIADGVLAYFAGGIVGEPEESS